MSTLLFLIHLALSFVSEDSIWSCQISQRKIYTNRPAPTVESPCYSRSNTGSYSKVPKIGASKFIEKQRVQVPEKNKEPSFLLANFRQSKPKGGCIVWGEIFQSSSALVKLRVSRGTFVDEFPLPRTRPYKGAAWEYELTGQCFSPVFELVDLE